MADNWALEINGGEDEDEALRRAIAMSLAAPPVAEQRGYGEPAHSGNGISNDDDEDDEELRRAIALSLREVAPLAVSENRGRAKPVQTANGTPITQPSNGDQSGSVTQHSQQLPLPPPKQPAPSMPFLGIDRKAMEEERLARLKKRKPEDSGDALEDQPPKQKLKSSKDFPESFQASSSAPNSQERLFPAMKTEAKQSPVKKTEPSVAPKKEPQSPAKENTSVSRTLSKLPFAQGVVKKTWARGQPRLGDDVTIEEVLQKNDLELAVFSSYQWDDEWFMSKLDLTKTRVLLVAYAADESQKEIMKSNVPPNIVSFCFPPMQGMGCMHSKLQLLKFSNYLRIVVPTGNLVPYDWGETGHMENMVFLIDLPRLDDPAKVASNGLTPFGLDLCYFLKAQGLDGKLIESLRKYDFAATARYGFVHTIAGSHVGEEWNRTGYCGLGRTVKGMDLDANHSVEIDYVCSSIGSINYGLLTALYNACQGDSGTKEYDQRTAKSAKGKTNKGADPPLELVETLKAQFRVYFPSADTVRRSLGGENSAGTICLQPRWWESSSFPREVFRDCKSTRTGVLMHSKVMFVRNRGEGLATGWAYIGSANLSESAWGRLTKDRGGNAKMTCRNYECGVLIPALKESREDSVPGVFGNSVPVPMRLPGFPLEAHGPQRPWFYNG